MSEGTDRTLPMRISDFIADRPAEGIFRVHRKVFTDPAIF